MAFVEPKRIDLRDYLRILARRFWLVLLPVVVALAAAFVMSMPRFMMPVYEASAKLEMEFPQPLSQSLQEIVNQPTAGAQFARIANLITSSDFLTKIIRQTGMMTDPGALSWARRNRDKYPTMTEEQLIELHLMKYLRNVIEAGQDRRQPNVLTISVRDYYPRRAYQLCETISQGIVDANEAITLEQMKATQDFALEQVANYRLKLQRAEEELQKYQTGAVRRTLREGLVTDGNVSAVRGLARSAEAQAQEAQGRQIRMARQVQDAGQDPQRWTQMVRPVDVEDLGNQYVDLMVDLARTEVEALGGPGGSTTSLSVQVANKRREFTDAVRNMIRTAGSGSQLNAAAQDAVADLLIADLDVRTANARHRYLSGQVDAFDNESARAPEMELEARRLQQEVDHLRRFLETFTEQITAAQIAEAFEAHKVGGRLQVLEPATQPLDPVYPNRFMIMVLSGMAGFFLGILLVFVVEHHDLTVRDIKELPSDVQSRVLGNMPLMKERLVKEREYRKAGVKGSIAPIFDYYRDEAASSFEFRRLVLELSRSGALPKSIMVTSAERSEGKTTTAVMLALTAARHRKARTLLVDLDFRRPSVHRQVGFAKHAPGAAEALRERTLPRDWIRPRPRAISSFCPRAASGTSRPSPRRRMRSNGSSRRCPRRSTSSSSICRPISPYRIPSSSGGSRRRCSSSSRRAARLNGSSCAATSSRREPRTMSPASC